MKKLLCISIILILFSSFTFFTACQTPTDDINESTTAQETTAIETDSETAVIQETTVVATDLETTATETSQSAREIPVFEDMSPVVRHNTEVLYDALNEIAVNDRLRKSALAFELWLMERYDEHFGFGEIVEVLNVAFHFSDYPRNTTGHYVVTMIDNNGEKYWITFYECGGIDQIERASDGAVLWS